MADLLALAEKFEKMATLDNSTLKRIERAKELADIVEELMKADFRKIREHIYGERLIENVSTTVGSRVTDLIIGDWVENVGY